MEKKSYKTIRSLLILLVSILLVYLLNNQVKNLSPKYLWNIILSFPIALGFCLNISKTIGKIKTKKKVLCVIILGVFILIFIYLVKISLGYIAGPFILFISMPLCIIFYIKMSEKILGVKFLKYGYSILTYILGIILIYLFKEIVLEYHLDVFFLLMTFILVGVAPLHMRKT